MGRRPKRLDPTASVAGLFGAKLRAYREANAWSQDELALKVHCIGDLISKIELARRTPSWKIAVAFDKIFATGEYFQELWPLVFKENPPGTALSDLEADAASIRAFGLTLVPAPLRTEDYQHVVVAPCYAPGNPEKPATGPADRKEDPPWTWAVMDEAAFHRPAACQKVMRAQIEHIIEIAHRARVAVQIVPAGSLYPGLGGPFTLLEFSSGLDAVHRGDQDGGRLVHDPATVEQCRIQFDLIGTTALPTRESLQLLDRL